MQIRPIFLNIDGVNNLLRILLRSGGQVMRRFGRSGRYAGQLHCVHSTAVDAREHPTGGVDNAKRVQNQAQQRSALVLAGC
jgi:hypothetical protein